MFVLCRDADNVWLLLVCCIDTEKAQGRACLSHIVSKQSSCQMQLCSGVDGSDMTVKIDICLEINCQWNFEIKKQIKIFEKNFF